MIRIRAARTLAHLLCLGLLGTAPFGVRTTQAAPGTPADAPHVAARATTYLFDDFESGTANWSLTGTWGLTATFSRSSTQSLTDSPLGNYPPNQSTSATLAHALDLSGATAPVLRFWTRGHIYNFDYAYVQVSTNGGSTWGTSWSRVAWYADGWSLEQIDLPKSSSVLVRFLLFSNDSGVEDGWYLDDVSIVEKDTARMPYPFTDDLESGIANWVVSGHDWDLTTSTSRSSSHSLTDSPAGNYVPNLTVSAMLAHPINLSGATAPVLRFWTRGHIYNFDYAYVQVSTDGGTSWGTSWSRVAWDADGWSLEQVDLPKVDNVVIRFLLFSNDSAVLDGWYVDDISIVEKDTARLPYPFADNLEGGLGNWVVSGHDWDLTTSTSRSSSHSLTDSPAGNYVPNLAVSAMLAHPIDLSGATAPVLRFWTRGHVYNFDYAYVQVSTNGGTSWSTSWSHVAWDADGWSLEQIDLPKVDNVVIRFLLFSNDSAVLDGWYVDDVSIVEKDTARLPYPFADDLESGMANWVVSGHDWDLTTSTSRSFSHSLTDSPAGNYVPNLAVSAMLAHPINLSGATAPVLRFWTRGHVYNFDYAYVQVSTDGGTNWSTYWSHVAWDADGWSLEQIDLPKVDNVVIRFLLFSNDSAVLDGWYVDDVSIVEKDTARLPYPFADDLESGLANWVVSGHDWDLTTSTSRSSSHSLTDSPGVNYVPNLSVSAMLAHPINLSGATAPVLRFWTRGHIYNFDYAYVQVSTNGGTSWSTSWSRVAWDADGWSLEQVDLPKVDNVVIRFLLFSNDSAVLDGWYVDDVSIVEKDAARLPYPFADNLESGLANWVVSGHDWALDTSTSRSSTHSLTDSPGGNYIPNLSVSAMLAHPINLSGATAPVLRFWTRGHIYNFDYAYVQVSTNGGTSWSTSWNRVSWYEDGWWLEQVELPKVDNVVIRFLLFSNDSAVEDGWYIDDITIGEKDTARLPVPFADGFDAGLANWLVSGRDWATTPAIGLLGPTAITDSPGGNYPASTTVAATLLHPVDLRGTPSPVLMFTSRGNIANGDCAYAQVSTDGGTNWSTYASVCTPTAQWDQHAVISLPSQDNVLVRFVMASNTDVAVSDGWSIDNVFIFGSTADAGDAPRLPQALALQPNSPNPFSGSTTIRYALPRAAQVKLSLFDVLGRAVITLEDGPRDAGEHAVTWDARDQSGNRVAPGLYTCRLEAEGRRMTRSLMVLK